MTETIYVGDEVGIIDGKNKRAKGTVKKIYPDGKFQVELKRKKPVYARSYQLKKLD